MNGYNECRNLSLEYPLIMSCASNTCREVNEGYYPLKPDSKRCDYEAANYIEGYTVISGAGIQCLVIR